jgi:hypothetical protein
VAPVLLLLHAVNEKSVEYALIDVLKTAKTDKDPPPSRGRRRQVLPVSRRRAGIAELPKSPLIDKGFSGAEYRGQNSYLSPKT